MTIRPIILAGLLGAFSAQASNYDVPTNCPPELPAPKVQGHQPKDPAGFTLMVMAVKFECCLVLYAMRLHGEGDPWDVHTFALQRSNRNYNSGQWETLAYRDTTLYGDKAKALFSDRMERDDPPDSGPTTYRIVDLGSVEVPNP
jgi:hypothetical protein